jgi:hypothetical protein
MEEFFASGFLVGFILLFVELAQNQKHLLLPLTVDCICVVNDWAWLSSYAQDV